MKYVAACYKITLYNRIGVNVMDIEKNDSVSEEEILTDETIENEEPAAAEEAPAEEAPAEVVEDTPAEEDVPAEVVEVKEKKKPAKRNVILACILAAVVFIGGILLLCLGGLGDTQPTEPDPTTEPTEPPKVYSAGFVAFVSTEAEYLNEAGEVLGTLLRGTEVQYLVTDDGKIELLMDGEIAYLQEGASVVSDMAAIIPVHTLYVRSAVNLRDIDAKLLAPLANKGMAVLVTGYDYLDEEGNAHMYKVDMDGETGYIMPWYLADNQEDALLNYDNGTYEKHANRGDRYGGGGAANLDYYPREKGEIEGNVMPEECRSLYVASWNVGLIDQYLKVAKDSGINTFVVDIMDGSAIGYTSEVMGKYSPSAVKHAANSVAKYQKAIQKIKDAGYYVVGRITTFNDSFFIKDNPETAITDNHGNALKLSKSYWPTAYNRLIWQYKVDLAVEAVELMGFNEIQFDYVRFPDLTAKYEKEGTIDYHNTYGETKAQAIQRFLMYATDILHEKGVYVSADVFGEAANPYVTAYGQYWPAISNVVDVISGMPYPDHYAKEGSWVPWLHPYDTIKRFGTTAMIRQTETSTPAIVRTWIQGHDTTWKKPNATYGAKEVAAQIKALRDSGCSGGYMIWGASLSKCKTLVSAFAPPEGE